MLGTPHDVPAVDVDGSGSAEGFRRCRFGKAEGGVGDVAQLDALLRGLQFSQKKADGEVCGNMSIGV
jgi:hypothetical protein